MVWEILHHRGWDNYYNLKNQQIAPPSELSSGGFEFLEESAFFENHVTDMGDSIFSVEFYVRGIRCAACVWLATYIECVTELLAHHRLQGA